MICCVFFVIIGVNIDCKVGLVLIMLMKVLILLLWVSCFFVGLKILVVIIDFFNISVVKV